MHISRFFFLQLAVCFLNVSLHCESVADGTKYALRSGCLLHLRPPRLRWSKLCGLPYPLLVCTLGDTLVRRRPRLGCCSGPSWSAFGVLPYPLVVRIFGVVLPPPPTHPHPTPTAELPTHHPRPPPSIRPSHPTPPSGTPPIPGVCRGHRTEGRPEGHPPGGTV